MTDREARNADSTEQAQLQEELQEEFLKTLDGLDEIEVGQLLDGTVVQIGPENVFVDIGYKSEGRVPLEEFEEKPEVGSSVKVVLLNKETGPGGVAVSKQKADERVFWRDLKQSYQDRQAVKGKVGKAVKGGFEIDLGSGIRGFNPISKMDLRRIENPDEYVGMESMFYVERLYSDNRVNIILSRRAWLEEEVDRKRSEFFENVEIGDDVEGTVKSFTSFGAFVDLGGFDGLLHINDMSWGHVNRPKDYVKKGQALTLKVIRMDPHEQKINLSLRHMTEDPWLHFEEKYHVDDVVNGTVTKLTDFGAFIELEEGIEGLAHISEMSWVRRISHPSEILKEGDEVETKILDYDIPQGRVSLGLKQVLPNPWDDIEEKYPEGMRLTGTVKKLTNAGAFVELEEGIDGFLHVDDLSWTKRYKNPGAVLTEGEEIECIVIRNDKENHNVRLGLKQLSEDPWASLKKAYPERSIIEGEVTNITDFGVFVRVQGGIEGLINKSNLADPKVASFEEAVSKVNVGDKIRAVVTELRPGRQRLSLSVRELERQEQRQELQKYIHSEESETTLTLGELLQEKEGGPEEEE
jgi:small subunit ribosomal protein S1